MGRNHSQIRDDVRPKERGVAKRLDAALREHDRTKRALPGIQQTASRRVLTAQIIESIRRIEYIAAIRRRDISPSRNDPHNDLFDPIKAAILHQRGGNIDEAFWLVFLSVHFGKHHTTGWRLTRDVYGSLGGHPIWTWARTSGNPDSFVRWLAAHQDTLRTDGTQRCFGNHRKYQSLDAESANGTGAAVKSYVGWVARHGTHLLLIDAAVQSCGDEPRELFDYLYDSMREVTSFGRMARFDYLTMVGKLGLAKIEPGSAYLDGATGPLKGARLLYQGSRARTHHPRDLDAWLVELANDLGIGMQIVEDALCNWQKSPDQFVYFRG